MSTDLGWRIERLESRLDDEEEKDAEQQRVVDALRRVGATRAADEIERLILRNQEILREAREDAAFVRKVSHL